MRKLRLRPKPLTQIMYPGCLWSLPSGTGYLAVILQPTHFTDGEDVAEYGSQPAQGRAALD